MRRSFIHILFFALLATAATGQSYPDSPVYRDYRPKTERQDRGSVYRQQLNLFLLEREAANGDALAQHELGVRYLTGRGVQADSVRSALWMKRSAEQQYTPAMYNYALHLVNGWGVDWNPFEAYTWFLRAAEKGMPEAQFVVGVFHTDNLVLRQNWTEAHRWMSLAAKEGHEAAQRGKDEIERRGHVPAGTQVYNSSATRANESRWDADSVDTNTSRGAKHPDDASDAPPSHTTTKETNRSDVDASADDRNTQAGSEAWAPLFLDFERDSMQTDLSTMRLLHDCILSLSLDTDDSLRFVALLDGGDGTNVALERLRRAALVCNPEAMLLLGRLYEEGRNVSANISRAAKCYLQASWYESPLALASLGRLLNVPRHRDILVKQAWEGDADAQYALAALRALEIDNRITPDQAMDFLRRAIESSSSDALVQLGLWYASGRLVTQDREKAMEAFQRAAAAQNEEARLRLAAAAVVSEGSPLPVAVALPILEAYAESGSLLALTALARSYEAGIGRSPNKGIAARMYRDAAVRGSHSAYAALRRMYDILRPR
ncbi:MAG: sel1 repeat family protein [Bacteroidia bacterium]|nr:sel1 repeat family protein [Bacteroidia bacterium]